MRGGGTSRGRREAITACRAFRSICHAIRAALRGCCTDDAKSLYEEEGDLEVGGGSSPERLPVVPGGKVRMAGAPRSKAANGPFSPFEQPALRGSCCSRRQKIPPAELDIEFSLASASGSREVRLPGTGRANTSDADPTPVPAAGVLYESSSRRRCTSTGAAKGRFQAAPEETLKLALAGLEKKKRVQGNDRCVDAVAGGLRVSAGNRCAAGGIAATRRTVRSGKPRPSKQACQGHRF